MPDLEGPTARTCIGVVRMRGATLRPYILSFRRSIVVVEGWVVGNDDKVKYVVIQ